MNEHIASALELFRSSRELDDEAIFRELVKRGLPRPLAARLVEFLPSAYCRALLRKSGVQFSDSFTRRTSKEEPKSLSSEPIWIDALEYAETEMRKDATRDEILMVAGRSAEFQGINQMLHKGSQLKNLALTPLSFPWPETGPEEHM